MVAGTDQLFEFRGAEGILPEVAKLELKAAPLQEFASLGAGGAAGFLEEAGAPGSRSGAGFGLCDRRLVMLPILLCFDGWRFSQRHAAK